MVALLLDEGLPKRAAASLRQLGWDVEHVLELGLGGAKDSAIVAYAQREGCTIATLDSDFGTLLAKSGDDAPSVLFLRIQGLDHEATVQVIASLPSEALDSLDAGAVVVHTGKSIRIRPLPIGS